MALGAEEATPSPQEREPASDWKEYENGEKTLNRLLNETIELSRELVIDKKHGKKDNQEALGRLEEQSREIERLREEQVQLMRKLKVAGPADEQPEEASDVYFQGWLLSRDAEKLKKEGKPTESRERLERALKLLERVAKEYPDWKPQMVQGRLKKTKEELAALPASDR